MSTIALIPSLDPTFGAVMVGLLIATFLEGVLTLQTYIYFTSFPDDRKSLRFLVGAIWFLDTLHLAIVCSMQYSYVITNYAKPGALLTANWQFDISVIVTSLIAFTIQLYFTWRTWVMSKSAIVSIVIGTLALGAFGTGLACGAETFLLVGFDRFVKFRWLVGLWLGCSAACDIVVAATLCFALYRSRTGFKQTDSILTRLIIWTLNTGLLTSIVAVMDLICFATMDNLVHFAFNVILGKLYANMFVATLNQRLRGRMIAHTSGLDFESHHGEQMWPSSLDHAKPNSKQSVFSKLSGMNVHITTTKETSTFPSADTPPTPMTPLGTHKYNNDKTVQLGDSIHDHDAAYDSDREKNVLPHFTSVGGEC